MFLLVDVVLGLVHFGFAVYLQQRLVCKIEEDHQQDAKAMMDKASHIVLYDLGFCVYCLVSPFSFIWQFMGLSWLGGCGAAGLGYLAAALLIIFAFVAGSFAVIWVCAMVCTSALGKNNAAKVAQTFM